MRKGEQTREHILEQAARLFNQKGYAGASLADVMEATGLQKGGIYRHFGSKEELAVEAFDYATRLMAARFSEALAGKEKAIDQLDAIIGVYAEIPENPPVPGGCPVMNAAIENDHGNPVLRERVRTAMDGLRALVRRVVSGGVRRGELRPGVDAEQLATIITATLEGAVMLSQLYGDAEHVRRAVEHLREHLREKVRA